MSKCDEEKELGWRDREDVAEPFAGEDTLSRRQLREIPLTQRPDWQLAFVLPNLQLDMPRDVPEDRPSELTLGLEGVAIVPTTDPRAIAIREWSGAADRFLGAFDDGYGAAISPALLIVRNDWDADMNRDVTPVISFRNAVAVSSILAVRSGVAPAVSSGERNSPGEDFTWFQPVEGLSRAAVELSGDGIEVSL